MNNPEVSSHRAAERDDFVEVCHDGGGVGILPAIGTITRERKKKKIF